jgi:dUTP pyrophosphatase
MSIFIKRCHPEATIPRKATSWAAGFDLHSIEECEIPAHEVKKISTGVCLEIPEDHFGKIFDRSSLAIRQLIILGGVIDNDYRGELFVILHNLSSTSYTVKKGDKVAQLVFIPQPRFEFRETCELKNTDRGEKGFGSSGK